MTISIERTTHATADARALIEELEADLSGDFEPHQRHGLSLDKIFQPHIAFFIARVDGKAVGCGGIAFENGFAELKRMYVRPDARERRSAVIAQLEAEATSTRRHPPVAGNRRRPHAALRVYERAGFKRCAAFRRHLPLPAHTIERSVFFEKHLA
jgi:putative acetyltransferase